MSGKAKVGEDDPPGSGNIWDSTAALVEHPLLQVAFSIVKENLQACISHSCRYLDSDNAGDHKAVLESLPGAFVVGDLPSNVHGRATPSGNGGIILNRTLVEASTSYARSRATVEGLIQDSGHSVLCYVAFLQEVIEHELGHWKCHVEGSKSLNGGSPDLQGDFFSVDTPERLRHEAGYAAQSQIREDHFGETATARTCKVLEVHEDVINYQNLTLSFLRLTSNPADHSNDEQFYYSDNEVEQTPPRITREQLLEHMNYPRAALCTSNKRKRGDSPDEGPSGQGRGGAGPGSGQPPGPSSAAHPSPGDRRPGPWLGSVQRFLPGAMNGAKLPRQQASRLSGQRETDTDGYDPLLVGCRPMAGYLQDQDSLVKHCAFELKLCDKGRREKSTFNQKESIYVKLTVRNTSVHPISVLIGDGPYFSRGNLHVQIDDKKPGWMHNNKSSKLLLEPKEISDRNTYTFFKTFTKPAGKKESEVAYATPPPGSYTARVWVKQVPIEVTFLFSVA